MVMLHLLVAVGVALLVGGAELLHARRVRRVARLAFGEAGRPALWTFVVPFARMGAAGLATWGLLFLATYDPVEIDRKPSRKASRHLLVCMDVSPSMQIKDAGPETEKIKRAQWAGKVVQGVLDRLDMETTRITLVGFYTEARVILNETFDKAVVSNALDGLPLYVGFEPGPTDVQKGVNRALELARTWPRDSATLVVVSDGDTLSNAGMGVIPDSIADSIVIGVGDPVISSLVGGHSSRQDTMSLKQLAARLGGYYHEGNKRHVPSEILDALTMIQPRMTDGIGLRDVALAATGIGCGVLGLTGPALMLFGRPGVYAKARRDVGNRTNSNGAMEAVS
jgi:Ca-activated chloride channel family protein